MCKIIFLHGYKSSGNKSNTGERIYNHFKDYEVIRPTYSSYSPKKSIEELSELIEEHINSDDEVVLVGISLGGFYARVLGNKYNLPIILLNPSINPSETLLSYDDDLLTEQVLSEYNELRVITDKPEVPISVVLATDDDIIPYETAQKEFKDRGYIVEVSTGGHRLDTEHAVNNYLNCIEWNINNVVYPQ